MRRVDHCDRRWKKWTCRRKDCFDHDFYRFKGFFPSPTNAMHGDIGIVSKDDVFLMISKSGESEELLQMVPFLRNRGVMPIAIVNNGNSRLAKGL